MITNEMFVDDMDITEDPIPPTVEKAQRKSRKSADATPSSSAAAQPDPPAPTYAVVALEITAVVHKKAEKPFLMLEGRELTANPAVPGDQADEAYWHWRLYLTPKAMTFVLYFLKKFDYPAELLEPLQLKKSKIIGLQGKVMFETKEWESAVGYSRLSETDLEEKLEKLKVPVIDIRADVKEDAKQEEDMSWLDEI